MAVLKPCGTMAAYKRHLKNGEKPCHECYKASAAYTAEKRRKDRERQSVAEVKAAPEISLLDAYLENLGIVKAALFRAVPREIAALSKRRQELEEAIVELQNKDSKLTTKSAVDELMARRKKRLAG